MHMMTEMPPVRGGEEVNTINNYRRARMEEWVQKISETRWVVNIRTLIGMDVIGIL